MTLADIGALIALVTGIIQTIYTVMAYNSSRRRPMPSKKNGVPVAQNRRTVMIVAALSLLSWAGIGYDFYDRRTHQSVDRNPILGYGVHGPLTFYANVATADLVKYKDDAKLVLAVRINYADVDEMSDTCIERSAEYTITGNVLMLSTKYAPERTALKVVPATKYGLSYYVILLPKQYKANAISTLSDVEKFGGKIIATRGQGVSPHDLGIEFRGN
jgi:hypothetical protein